MKDAFLNVDFYRTIISVIIGGTISLSSVLIIEYKKNKKELREKKRQIFNGLITTINSLRRLEVSALQHSIAFNYHRRNYDLNETEHSQNQAEYHQNHQDNELNKIINKAEQLDLYSLDYKIYIGEDNQFDEMIDKFHNWPRPQRPNYSKIINLIDLNNQLNKDTKSITEFSTNYWKTEINRFSEYLRTKLI